MATNAHVSECAIRILDAVPPAVWFIRGQMRRHRKGLSIPQFRALYFINSNPSASLSQVAEHLAASLPSTSRLIAGLQARNLIERRGNKDDRRLIELLATPRGRRVMDSARSATLACLDLQLAKLQQPQQVRLGNAMVLLKKLFEPALPALRKVRGEP
jgi:DNA-binding MarR family transcriptional regulator